MNYILHGKHISICNSSEITGRIVVYLYNKQIVALRFDHPTLKESVTVNYIHDEDGGKVSLKSFFKAVCNGSNADTIIPTYIELNGAGNVHLCSIYQNDKGFIGGSRCNILKEKLFIPTNATLPKSGACKFTVEDLHQIQIQILQDGWRLIFRFAHEATEVLPLSEDKIIRLSATHTTGGIFIRKGIEIQYPDTSDKAVMRLHELEKFLTFDKGYDIEINKYSSKNVILTYR